MLDIVVNIRNFTLKLFDFLLERGYSVYKNGKIEDLGSYLDGKYFLVQGTKSYNVHININKDNDIKLWSCTCPYYNEHNTCCKHIVACLYYICNERGIEPFKKEDCIIVVDENGNRITDFSEFELVKNSHIETNNSCDT